jgi:hypothetical protein
VSTSRVFACPKYEPLAGSRRCRHYVEGGACDLPDELMCLEWLKANGHTPQLSAPTPPPLEQDLFGAAYVHPAPIRGHAHALAPVASTTPPAAPAPPALNAAALTSFQALDVEVRVEADDIGELWLVPAYTGSGRQELSLEHAALLATLCSALPSARITALVRKSKAMST